MGSLKYLMIAFLAGTALSDCLATSFYNSLGLTSYSAPKTTDIKICKNMYTQFGYCTDQDQVIQMVSDKLYQQTRGILTKGDGLNRLLNKVNNRIDAMLSNTKKVAASPTLASSTLASDTTARRLLQTVPLKNPPAKTTTSDTTKTFTPKEKSKVPRKSAKKMSLKTETLTALENFKTKLNSDIAIVNKFANKEARQACYKALFRVYIGTTCVVTSGAATTYTTLQGNQIVSVAVAQADAASVTTNCLQLIYPVCLARSAQATFNSLTNNGVNNGFNSGKKAQFDAVCAAIDASPSCLQTPSSCSADIQKLVLQNMINASDDPLGSDVDLQVTADLFDTADVSTAETLTTNSQTAARRLQTGGASYSYQVTANAPGASDEADKSLIPTDSVEANIASEVPASAGGSTNNTGSGVRALVGNLVAAMLVGLFVWTK